MVLRSLPGEPRVSPRPPVVSAAQGHDTRNAARRRHARLSWLVGHCGAPRASVDCLRGCSMTFGKPTPIVRIFDEAKAREFYVDFLGFKVD